MRIDRRDIPWLLALVASLTLGVAVSWQRWGSALVDCGREMNQPLRLLDGERLFYSTKKKDEEKDEEKEKCKVTAMVHTSLMYRHWDTYEDGKVQHLFYVDTDGGEPR